MEWSDSGLIRHHLEEASITAKMMPTAGDKAQ